MRYKELSDKELVNLLKVDDEMALSALYFRYWDKLLSVAFHRMEGVDITGESGAEEIVQDIFIKLWERRQTVELTHSLSTYLNVAVKYRVINAIDKASRKRSQIEKSEFYRDEEILTVSPDAYIFEQELMAKIETSVNRLPEKCRIVFRMSREDGLTNKQIAADLNIAEKTVEAHMTKAIKDIKSDLAAIGPLAILLFIEQVKLPN